MGAFPDADFALAATSLPPKLTTAIANDLKISPARYLAEAAATQQATQVVAELKADGVEVLGYSMHGRGLFVNLAQSNVSGARIVKSLGASVVIGKPHVDRLRPAVRLDSSYNLYGGSGIVFDTGTSYGVARCSIGFNGFASATGASQSLTAGHCVRTMTGSVYSVTGTTPNTGGFVEGALIGTPVKSESSYHQGAFGQQYNSDYGVIAVSAPGVYTTPAISTWGGAQGDVNSAPLSITGTIAPVVGANVCNSGSTSGWSCGTITGNDASDLSYGDSSFASTACANSGDSGGAEVVGTLAVGITVGGDCDGSDFSSIAFPMVSTPGGVSVSSHLNGLWELAVAVSAPIVTDISGSTLSGTLPNASQGSNVAVTFDGNAATSVSVDASSGSWAFPLSQLNSGAHSYSVVASWGQHSFSLPITGTLTTNSIGTSYALSPSDFEKFVTVVWRMSVDPFDPDHNPNDADNARYRQYGVTYKNTVNALKAGGPRAYPATLVSQTAESAVTADDLNVPDDARAGQYLIASYPNTAATRALLADGTLRLDSSGHSTVDLGSKTFTIVPSWTPLWISTTLPGAAVGVSYSAPISATNYFAAAGDPTTYDLSGPRASNRRSFLPLPAGFPFSVNPTTGVISGTPSQPGTYNFTVVAYSANSSVAPRSVSIVVTG